MLDVVLHGGGEQPLFIARLLAPLYSDIAFKRPAIR